MSLHPAAPALLTTTPAGQLHELGALLAGALAATQGWRVIHAGASLPAAEIASAARLNAVVAVALSIVHPATDDALNEELFRLRRLLPAQIDLVVGGRAASAYQETLTRIDATRIGSLEAWLAFVSQHPRR
jgi:methylmalonyl-CoA mutase cobalamin-binding subunit